MIKMTQADGYGCSFILSLSSIGTSFAFLVILHWLELCSFNQHL
jgi:hypothetical protein